MPAKAQVNRTEPARTRKASKKDKDLKSVSDIVEAISKMAPTREKSKSRDLVLSENSSTREKSQEITHNESPDTDREITETTQSSINATELNNEALSDDHDNYTDSANAEPSTLIDNQRKQLSFKDAANADNTQMLDALQELTNSYAKLDDTVNHPTKGVGAQAVKLTLRCDDLYSDIHGAVNGLLVRMQKLEAENLQKDAKIKHLEEAQTRLSSMITENKKTSKDLVIAQGLIQKYNQKFQAMENKILDLTRRGMEQNIVIHGIEELPHPNKEFCHRSAFDFLEQMLEIEIEESDVWKAYRMGNLKREKARPMFVKLSYKAKDRVMENVSKLKDKRNKHNQAYFVSEQIPEGIAETRKQLSQKLKVIRDKEAEKPENQRKEVKIIGGKIVRAGEIIKPRIQTPQPYELFPSMEEQHKINQMAGKLRESPPIYQMNSTFVGLAVEVDSFQEINLAYKAVMQRFPYMDHVIMAYQLKQGELLHHGSCNDTEYGAGSVIEKLMFSQGLEKTAVFVVRRYGGIHLGYDRFQIIQNAAQAAINLLHPQN